MHEKTDRFYVSGRPTIIEGFRALRAALEKVVEARGGKLDAAWYDDGPERQPHLYKDQSEISKQTPTEGEDT